MGYGLVGALKLVLGIPELAASSLCELLTVLSGPLADVTQVADSLGGMAGSPF